MYLLLAGKTEFAGKQIKFKWCCKKKVYGTQIWNVNSSLISKNKSLCGKY